MWPTPPRRREAAALDPLKEPSRRRGVVIDAELEFELPELEPGERAEFMAELEMTQAGLDRLIRGHSTFWG